MSGRKNQLSKFKIVSAGDMSQATVTSTVVNIQGLDNIGIQVNILTGTANGTLSVQTSIDHAEGTAVATGNWVSLPSTYTQTIASGSPANVIWDLNQISAPFIRLLYTKTSGTGTFDAFVCGKMI